MDNEEAIDTISSAIRSIAHGGAYGPSGLELLAMAICGKGPTEFNSLSGAVYAVAEALADIARALEAQNNGH